MSSSEKCGSDCVETHEPRHAANAGRFGERLLPIVVLVAVTAWTSLLAGALVGAPTALAVGLPPAAASSGTEWAPPIIAYPAQHDTDGDRILNTLDADLEVHRNDPERVQVIVVLDGPPTSADVERFEALGGTVLRTWTFATYGWLGEMPWSRLEEAPLSLGAGLVYIEHDAKAAGRQNLDVATSIVQARTRVWNTYGFTGDADGTIAILDSGLDGAHDDLGDPDHDNAFNDPDDWNEACVNGFDGKRIQGWWNFISSSQNPVDPNPASDGHGTAVAGCAAGDGTIDSNMKGIAPSSHLAGFRIGDLSAGYSTSDAITAMNTLIANKECARIKVANMSISYPANQTLLSAANNVVLNGIVFTIAAGNRYDNCTCASEDTCDDILYPGVADHVITVGATNDLDQIAGYSSRGPAGVAKPDLVAPGGGMVGAGGLITTTTHAPNDTYLGRVGTSFAAPIVAGAASLVIDAWEQTDGFSWGWNAMDARRVKNALLATAVEIDETGEDPDGAGCQPPNSPGPKSRGGHDPVEGWGRLNVDAAVEAMTMDLAAGAREVGTLGSAVTDKKVWARRILVTGPCVHVELQVPATGDYDVYLYDVLGSSNGTPVIQGSSTEAALGGFEIIDLDIGLVGLPYLLVVKWVEGSGDFAVEFEDATLDWVDATHGDPLNGNGPAFGLAWGDFDNDGDEDLYLSRGSNPNALLRNDGYGRFTDVSVSPLDLTIDARAAVWVDVDRDDDLDLFVCGYGVAGLPNRLFRNDSQGGTVSFVEIVGAFQGNSPSLHAAWADIDNDSDLDLYVANYNAPDRLFRNDWAAPGDIILTDVTGAYGLGDGGRGTNATFADVDNDGDADLYVARSNLQTNRLYRNDGGTAFVNTANTPEADAGNGQSASWGDIDNDGDLDLYVSNFDTGSNRVLRNDGGDGSGGIAFVDVTSGPEGPIDFSFGAAWGDYDLDGLLDLYVTAGTPETNALLLNQGGGFSDVTPAIMSGALSEQSVVMQWVDPDRDGDLDLYVGNLNASNRYFENSACRTNHWVKVKVSAVGKEFVPGVGARVEIEAGGVSQMREIASGSSSFAHFGVGSATTIDVVRITWPTGETHEAFDVPSDMEYLFGVVSVADGSSPTRFGDARLLGNTPNPFNPTTTIRFELQRADEVTVDIFDVRGTFVRRVVDEGLSAGTHAVAWDGRDGRGLPLSSGVYFVRFDSGGVVDRHKMMLLK